MKIPLPRVVCLALLLAVGSSVALAQSGGNKPVDASAKPAAAPDENFDSPRATLQTFLLRMKEVQNSEDTSAWNDIFKAMDISGTLGQAARKDIAWKLMAVYSDGLKNTPQPQALPDRAAADTRNLERFELLPRNLGAADTPPWAHDISKKAGDPPVPILMVRKDTREWKFAPETLDSIDRLVTWAAPLGVRRGGGFLAHVQSELMRRWIPASLQGRYLFGVEFWQWVGLATIIFISLALDLFSRKALCRMLPRFASHFLRGVDADTIQITVRPIGLAVGAAAFLLMLTLLGLAGMPQAILYVAGRVVLVIALTWTAWMLADLFSDILAARSIKTHMPLDDMVVTLLRKTAKLLILAMGVIYLASAFNIELLPLLTGFGIAGLAVSFAAQDMVKNIFGGLAIFLDRPFRIGDRILFKGFDGTVDDVGFRVTRLRLGNGNLVTLPNAGITSDPVENVSHRPFIDRTIDLRLGGDTSADQVERAVEIIRGILEEKGIAEPIHIPAFPPRVHLSQLNDTNLSIQVRYRYSPPNWWDYMAHAQRLHLRIMRELAQAGIDLALFTPTYYIADDPRKKFTVRLANPRPSQEEGAGR